MGREVKRVALDFNWPLDKTWEGFLNPHYQECVVCNGRGSTSDELWLNSIVYLLMMLGERKHGLHPWLAAKGLCHWHRSCISYQCRYGMPGGTGRELRGLIGNLIDLESSDRLFDWRI